jgi:hypothetical protein
MIEQRLQVALRTTQGGPDACLYMGPRVTKRFSAKLLFGSNGYEFTLVPTINNQFAFAEEVTVFHGNFGENRNSLGSGHAEARLKTLKDERGKWGAARGVQHYVYDAVSSWIVYHFHDTSLSAGSDDKDPQ